MGRRSRSPNYPRISLKDAIERVEKLYRKERTHKTTREAVAEGLGYNSLNGSSLGIIGTLKQYGLLEEDSEGVRVSQDAVALVMLPKDEPERMEALRTAASTPRLFSELREEYGDSLPSDVSLRYALIKKGYSERAANEVIRSYRDTLDLVSEEGGGYTDADVEDQQEVEPPMRQPTAAQGTTSRSSPGPFAGSSDFSDLLTIAGRHLASPDATILQYPLPGNSTARIELTGNVTQEAIDMLTAILNTQKLVFPKADQVERPAIEQPPEQPALESPETE